MNKAIIIFILTVFYLLNIFDYSFANDISVSNVSIEGINTDEEYAFIEFDLSGKNAWRTSTDAENYEAIWIFAKFRVNDGVWKHVMLSKNDNEHIGVEDLATNAQSDGMGVYIYYTGNASGNFDTYIIENLKIRWNFGENGLTGTETDIDVQVFAIEMVYVPEGSFYIGSGGTEHNHFYTYGSNNPYQITSEAVITVGTNTGNLYYNWDDGAFNEGGDREGPIPANYPKGYNGFYIMQYEISQEQYVDFLNTLTRTQQDARVDANETYPVSETSSMSNRNGIKLNSNGSNPYTFYCDFDDDDIMNEANDGQNIACNFLSWDDGLAYLDWAGLRPMTELEFEKACRGTANVVADEYAWGSTNLLQVSGMNNSGTTSETAGNAGLGLCNYNSSDNGNLGPLRCGFAATTVDVPNKRQQSGSSFYGVMNLSGNLSEHCVTVGNSDGRNYTGNNGDGDVSSSTGWPNHNAYADRGGNFVRNNTRIQVSNRSRATIGANDKYTNVGWRGVRSVEL